MSEPRPHSVWPSLGLANVTPGKGGSHVQWFHVAEASFMAPGVAALFHYNLDSDKNPEVKKKALKCIHDVLQVTASPILKQTALSHAF